jgi:hypothetical protein
VAQKVTTKRESINLFSNVKKGEEKAVLMGETGSPNYKLTIIPNKAHQYSEVILSNLTQDQDTVKVILFGFRMAKLNQYI